MKSYQRFIAFVVFFTAGFYWLNETVKIPYLSAGLISVVIFLVFVLWDRWLWKTKWLFIPLLGKLIGFHNYPNISGKWKIEYHSSYNFDSSNSQYTTTGTGEAEIKQTYSSVFISGVFGESSKFESFVAMFKEKENRSCFLIYGYRNNPIDVKLKHSPSGGMHEGFCYLEVCKDGKLDGYYTNDENRKTRGKIVLTRMEA